MANVNKINQGAIALDEARLKRLKINEGDFERYMQQRDFSDHENIKPATEFSSELITFFNTESAYAGASLP